MLPKSQGGSPKVTVETGPASPHPHLLRSSGWTMATCTKAFLCPREHRRRVVAPAEAALDLSLAMTVQATYLLVDVLIIWAQLRVHHHCDLNFLKHGLALQRCLLLNKWRGLVTHLEASFSLGATQLPVCLSSQQAGHVSFFQVALL